MIYIASPYSHPDFTIRVQRYKAARAYAHLLMEMGQACFSPIAYGHQFSAEFGAPINFEAWSDFNDRILLACDQFHILTISGWEESRGIAHELSIANNYNIPVAHVYFEVHHEDN